jgi:ABC-type tungstate transport system permease subunit
LLLWAGLGVNPHPALFFCHGRTAEDREEEWLTSREAQLIIRDFQKDVYGEPLFFPNSEAGKNL